MQMSDYIDVIISVIDRQSFRLFGKEHAINMQIRDNSGFILAQRTNGKNLSHID